MNIDVASIMNFVVRQDFNVNRKEFKQTLAFPVRESTIIAFREINGFQHRKTYLEKVFHPNLELIQDRRIFKIASKLFVVKATVLKPDRLVLFPFSWKKYPKRAAAEV